MTVLIDAVLSCGYQNTPEAILERLNSTIQLPFDTEVYKWSGANKRLIAMGVPIELVATWDQLLPQLPGGTMMVEMLRTGVDLSDEHLQQQLQLVLQLTDDKRAHLILNALLAIGRPSTLYYRQAGLAELPTLKEIAEVQELAADAVAIDEIRAQAVGAAAAVRQFQEVLDQDILQPGRNAYESVANAKAAVASDARVNAEAIDALITRLQELKKALA
jgi:hypothetical protein